MDYVSLHNHTHFSILDALSSPKELILKAKELGQKAIAITDHGTLAASWEAYKVAKDANVKLIIGVEIYFIEDVSKQKVLIQSQPPVHPDEPVQEEEVFISEKPRHIILLAKNEIGYKNILTINRLGFDNNPNISKRAYPIIDWKLLEQYSEGVICLTACSNGIVGRLLMDKKFEEAERTVLRLKSIFMDNFGLEVQANNLKRGSNNYMDAVEQSYVNRQIINIAKKHNVKIVPTTNSHYINKEDAETHDVFLAIGSHQPVSSGFRIKYPVPDFYVKSYDEVKSFFERNYGEEFADEIIKNSIYFADKCEIPNWIDPKYSNPSGKELPVFPVKDEPNYNEFINWTKSQPEEIRNLEEDRLYLRYKCYENYNKIPEDKKNEYQGRLDKEEFDVIEYHDFSSYMLIVADYVAWARKNNIPVGPGRGSVGGSLIAYLIDIHRADPIKYRLIFSRFHNKEKTSYPDIDLDFATSGRDRVKDYIRNKYGVDYVAHVSNINTITPKVYVRDICRACELGGSREAAVQLGNDIADIIPKEISSIESAYNSIPLFVEYCKKYPELIKYKMIDGKYRALSTHAGGVIISRRPLVGLIPLRKDKDGLIAIELDKYGAEETGLVKMDILGLSTLDIKDQTIKLIEKHGKHFSYDQINYDVYDEKTYNLISSGDTFGVFQFGTSGGTIDLCKKIKPKSIEDLANITALARPSAKDIREKFVAIRDGKAQPTLLDPKLNRAFEFSNGLPLYEESLLYLAQDVAGWNLHEADRLRKLTKEKGKNPKKAQQWRKDFIDGAVKNRVNDIVATRIWDECVDNFQGYGFNLSHAVLYSMISYETAYLKAHYPIEFLLANLMHELKSNGPGAEENAERIKKEIRKNRVKILPPDINKSDLSYTLYGNKLLTGLEAIKYVTEDCINEIVAKRPFKNFFDFMSKVSSSKVRANAIQALVACGALDCFKLTRKTMFLYCSDYRKKLQVWLKSHDPNKEKMEYPFPDEGEWSKPELFALERKYLGEAFVCGKVEAFGKFFELHAGTLKGLKKINKLPIPSLKVEVKDFFEFKIKKEGSKFLGQTMAKVLVEDADNNQITVTFFPDRWEQMHDVIKTLHKGKFVFSAGVGLHIAGQINIYDGETMIIADSIYNVVPPPSLPNDLAARKISLKRADRKSKNLFENIEDSMTNEGLLDIED